MGAIKKIDVLMYVKVFLLSFWLLAMGETQAQTGVEVILPDSAGASAFEVKNSGTATHFRLQSNGLMGIGTTTPAAVLHIEGTSTVGTALKVNGTVTVTTGNVGIGTTTPAFKLHVRGDDQSIAVSSDDAVIARLGRDSSTGAGLDQGKLILFEGGEFLVYYSQGNQEGQTG